MKFRSLAASCAVFLLSSAGALAQCNSGTATAIVLESWSAQAGDRAGTTAVTMTLRNAMDTGIRLVDGSVWFSDVLGGSIGGIKIERSTTAEAGATFSQQNAMIGLGDLVSLNPDDIVATACTNAVVTADGAVIENPRGAGPARPFTDEDRAAFVDAVRRCWNPPLSTMIAARIEGTSATATIRVEMNPDGTVADTEVIEAGDESMGLAAERAVLQCGPYTSLPETAYESWQTMELTLGASGD